jgi:hypothetical protein
MTTDAGPVTAVETRTAPRDSEPTPTGAELRESLHAAAAIDAAPRRHPALHWAAVGTSLLSLLLLAASLSNPTGGVPGDWLALDVTLSALFLAEFFTRSGFRWARARYMVSHFFDFVAMVPALALVGFGYPYESQWVWLILAMRAVRAIDRLLGDGFVKRNVFALIEGFEEEITDRVLLRILDRLAGDLGRGRFGEAVGAALARNRDSMLERARAAFPVDGPAGELAHFTGLDVALRRAEERAYDAIVEVVASREVDIAIRDVLASTFASMRKEMSGRSRYHDLGLHGPTANDSEPSRLAPNEAAATGAR